MPRLGCATAGYLPPMSERPDDEPPTDSGFGYPEDSQPDTGIDPAKHPENQVDDDDDAPDTHAAEDGDAGQATGNPRAAGGDG
jgi:hypothetical protein